ncbi:MAG TPA: DUF4271 domain-containing protein [Mucilaginibacter sp.]
MRFTFFCLLFISMGCFAVYGQGDTSVSKGSANLVNMPLPDSVAAAKEKREQFMSDSIAKAYLMPDSSRRSQFMSNLRKNNFQNFFSKSQSRVKKKNILKSGQVRNSRDPWVITVIIGLLIYTALLNLFLSQDIKNVVRSFYDKLAFSKVDREAGMVNTWAFVGLFVLFSLTAGIVLYQVMVYENVYYSISGFGGFQLFVMLSVGVSILFALKLIVLKFIGFVFGAGRLVSEYIGILNLTYFNIAFVLLFVALCFSLLANRFIPSLLVFTLASIAIIFAWQYLRNSANVISNFRFHKFYLFIYLCALEICPVLILIKALNI